MESGIILMLDNQTGKMVIFKEYGGECKVIQFHCNHRIKVSSVIRLRITQTDELNKARLQHSPLCTMLK